MDHDYVEDAEAQYLSPLEKARLRNDQLNRKAREESAFVRFFQTTGYPIEPNQANEGILRGMFGSSDIEITVAALEEVFQILLSRENNPLCMRTPNRERQKHEELIDQLFQEDARLYGQSTRGQQVERKNLGYWTNDQLQERLTNTREEKRLRGMSIDQLKAERAQNKPAPAGLPPLPERFPAAVIKCMSAPALRMLIRQYGEESINRRLQGID